jgi:hypothetical protein
VPSAKKIIIHGPDLSQIPTQLPIYDTTQFSFVIQESFEFFSIPESKRDKYFLFDAKTSKNLVFIFFVVYLLYYALFLILNQRSNSSAR